MLDLLSQIVQQGESFKLTYSRANDDKVRLIVQPRLDDGLENLTDKDALAARAALQRPLVLEGSHADVAAKFAAHVAASRDDRETLKDAYECLSGATERAAKAAAEAAKKKQVGAEKSQAEAASGKDAEHTPNTDDSASDVPAPGDDGDQPASIF